MPSKTRLVPALVAAALLMALSLAPAAQAREQSAYAPSSYGYLLTSITITKGDTLRFHNLDMMARHDLDSDRRDRRRRLLFSSPLIPGLKSTLVSGVARLNPGRYGFHCSLHPWMRGTLTVNRPSGY